MAKRAKLVPQAEAGPLAAAEGFAERRRLKLATGQPANFDAHMFTNFDDDMFTDAGGPSCSSAGVAACTSPGGAVALGQLVSAAGALGSAAPVAALALGAAWLLRGVLRQVRRVHLLLRLRPF